MKPTKHSIRIIAGEHRSRLLNVIDKEGLRPTSNRVRETLFNWIQPLLAANHCLDLFAGSGALGMEALSRGAKSVTFIEKDREAFHVLQNNVKSIIKDDSCYQLINSDAIAYLEKTVRAFNVIFLDPPFGYPDLLNQALNIIQQRAVFDSVKYIVVERSINALLPTIENFQLHREMKTKESNLSVWMRHINAA